MSATSGLTRRAVLAAGAAAAVAAVLPAAAQTPRRGGTFRISLGDPPHFDPHLTAQWSTQIALSFTHSRLPQAPGRTGCRPGTFAIEGDLAESWERTADTDVRVQAPPRRAVACQAARQRPRAHRRGREVHVRPLPRHHRQPPPRRPRGRSTGSTSLDRYTVRFTLQSAVRVVPRRRSPPPPRGSSRGRRSSSTATSSGRRRASAPDRGCSSATIRNVRLSWVRHPDYFAPGLPYADAVEAIDGGRPASRAGPLAQRPVRLRPGLGMVVRRLDLDTVRQPKAGPADGRVPLDGERLRRDEARPGAVPRRSRAPRARARDELSGDPRREPDRAGARGPDAGGARRAGRMGDPASTSSRRRGGGSTSTTARPRRACSPRPGIRPASRCRSRPRRSARTGSTRVQVYLRRSGSRPGSRSTSRSRRPAPS